MKKLPGNSSLRKSYLFTLIVFLLCASFLFSGCELLEMLGESEQEQVQDTAEEWVEAQDLNVTNDDGSVNPDGVVKVAKRVVTNSTGDPEVDAALNSDNAIKKINKADELAERGWKEPNRKYFDQAILLRPEDWKYRIERASWEMGYFDAPEMKLVDNDFKAAENLLGPDKSERIAYAQFGIAKLEAVKTAMAKSHFKGQALPLFDRRHDCQTLFSRLAHFYNILADQTGSSSDRAMAEQYTRDLGKCQPLP